MSNQTIRYWIGFLRENGHQRAADSIEREIALDEEQRTMWDVTDD